MRRERICAQDFHCEEQCTRDDDIAGRRMHGSFEYNKMNSEVSRQPRKVRLAANVGLLVRL